MYNSIYRLFYLKRKIKRARLTKITFFIDEVANKDNLIEV